jgi:pimeloyl-ACP methyl ester carboxylesterase
MKFRQVLTSCILTTTLAVSQSLFLSSQNQAKAQSSRPYIVLVNGYQNCCAWGITERFPSMNAEIRSVPYSNFSNGGTSGNTSNDSAFLEKGADFINNQLDKSRPLILIGHSFGGDSVLKLLPRINRKIQFVAVIDPVRTGGLRASLKNLRVPSNVEYFFNRWQENLPFPNDFQTNGSIPCSAKQCDQDSQNIARNADFSPLTTECRWDEVTCPGFVAPNPFIGRRGKKGRKQVRVSHQDLPKDAFMQTDLGNKIKRQLVAFRPPSPPSDSLPLSQLPPGSDQGYGNLPRAFVDVNGDGRADYCRFVGDTPNIFIACILRTSDGSWGGQYDYKSIIGIDQGYSDRPRGFKDANGDGRADYCRFVGNAPKIFESCNLSTPSGFDSNQYTLNIGL